MACVRLPLKGAGCLVDFVARSSCGWKTKLISLDGMQEKHICSPYTPDICSPYTPVTHGSERRRGPLLCSALPGNAVHLHAAPSVRARRCVTRDVRICTTASGGTEEIGTLRVEGGGCRAVAVHVGLRGSVATQRWWRALCRIHITHFQRLFKSAMGICYGIPFL